MQRHHRLGREPMMGGNIGKVLAALAAGDDTDLEQTAGNTSRLDGWPNIKEASRQLRRIDMMRIEHHQQAVHAGLHVDHAVPAADPVAQSPDPLLCRERERSLGIKQQRGAATQADARLGEDHDTGIQSAALSCGARVRVKSGRLVMNSSPFSTWMVAMIPSSGAVTVLKTSTPSCIQTS